MSTIPITRESLIRDYVTGIRTVEGKHSGSGVDRGYILDLVAEVAIALDGRRGSDRRPTPAPDRAKGKRLSGLAAE